MNGLIQNISLPTLVSSGNACWAGRTQAGGAPGARPHLWDLQWGSVCTTKAFLNQVDQRGPIKLGKSNETK